MVKYEVVCEDFVTLRIMGRKRVFNNGETCKENAYTKNYPQYFKRIGEMVGYNLYLATPTFIPDSINDFMRKEEIRKSEKIEPVIETIEAPKPIEFDSIEDLLAEDTEVTIETEE